MDLFLFREPFSAWTHFSWMILSIPGTWLLWCRGRGDGAKQISLLIFGLSLIFCYGCSTLFHGVRTTSRFVTMLEALDHVGIFLLIAGSYTAVTVTLLNSLWRSVSLGLVWAFAVTGIVLRISATPIHPWVSTGLYLLLGWGVVLPYFQWARILSHGALVPVALGGVCYSVGALFDRLDISVFGLTGHEGAHLWIMAGSLAHYVFVLRHVVPRERRSGERRASEAGADPTSWAADRVHSEHPLRPA